MKVVRDGVRDVDDDAVTSDVELTRRCGPAVERVCESRDEL